ncbi:MAG: OmpH family outer membrane protein [Chitinophagaceae bacterium]|jgi:outer membrane protein|nr:OmpH family outer membrane protein [Chitinophagaceae bacterium]
MKNGLLVWNVLLTLVAGYLLFTHFSSNKKTATGEKKETGAAATVNKDFRIAYFEMDSIEANFSMVKDVKAELSKKEETMNAEMERLGKNLQEKYNYFQGQAQAGSLTEAQQQAAGQELKNLDDQMKNRKQLLDQEYSDFVMRRMKDVKTKIEDFLKEYNKEKNYSYIVSYEQGLFYYKDSVYNITADVIKGLNGIYKPGSKKD